MICENVPECINKYFNDFFILMGKIHEKIDIADESIRVLAFENLIIFIEKKKKILKNDDSKLKIIIEQNFKYALEMEEELNNDWLYPNSESFLEEEIIEEDKIRTALTFVNRIIEVYDEDAMQIISQFILNLIKTEKGWKFKYLGLMTISQIAEFIDDLTLFEPIFKVF